jgi:hypothetical protein
MNRAALQADQLYTWSDTNAHQNAHTVFHCRPTTTAPTAITPAATVRSSVAGLAHRALQTLRQARMQVCTRPRSWPQVLPLGQSLWPATANGLHPPGLSKPSQRVSGQLPSSPRDFGRDLRHQSRTATPPRGALSHSHEPCCCLALRSFRSQTRRPALGQYALRMARCRTQRRSHRGGCL